MDGLGLAAAVIYPTAGLGLGFAREYDWVVDLTAAYNNFLSDKYLKVSPRLKAVALLPVHKPAEAAKELRRAVTELGMVGGVLPTPGLRYPYGETFFDPLYEEAQRLGVMLGIHGASHRVLGWENLFSDEHPRAAFVLGHPFAQMTQFVSMVYGRVWNRFPKLKMAFLEASCGWVPYLLERLDRHSDGSGARLGSDTVRNHPIYFHAELDDGPTLPMAADVIGDDRLIYASDFPHEAVDDITEGLHGFLERDDLSHTTKERILRDNIKVLYGLT
jgi:predicted TIM-barrel fold metal-dependent hydrolase